ncbi:MULTISPECIES: hypothetical protein [unclassified Mycolicibacterium]|uniref:hypothetical protein n=1 Tax=unclassified Mycolicibacterium TaxID=2636767 RepID=UPI001307FE72|nr:MULTISPECIES: hypothetical protein [unclassified Mycolicibacterium]MUL84579.1 hypothetical protein [Mycolicibacterium sp. CBMA 329]MUL88354.1 hypothetical protein [Mycolicibacterium sp. CBMA 331]MUL99197.1 hypothetical protein [Mycolicibacterium sp. CBMA 334]MUM25042.1 hypothetical protein [Mycolicibacterium sp. CBMA 295]MUM40001.1 hypothetical protein [Mycolicibacterium sp. CBMA 247]
MTAAGNFRSTASRADREVRIAGVPWPAYKLIALAAGLLALVVVGAATMTAAPAVLSAAAVATIAWIGLGAVSSSDR